MHALSLLPLLFVSCVSTPRAVDPQDAAVHAERTIVRATSVSMRHVGARTRSITVADTRVQEASHGSRRELRPLRVHFRH